MQGRRVELVRAEVDGGREYDAGPSSSSRRDIASIFPSKQQRDKDKLADAAKELGIIRDSSAFVSGGDAGATTGAVTSTNPVEHFDGSGSLGEALLKQKLEKQELRDAAIKASKVPIYDDDDHFFLDSVMEARVAKARQTRERENDALAEFKRMQSKAMTSVQSAGELLGDRSAVPGTKRGDAKRAGRLRVVRLDVKRQRTGKDVGSEEDEDGDKDGDKDGDDLESDDDGVENLFGCYGEDSD